VGERNEEIKNVGEKIKQKPPPGTSPDPELNGDLLHYMTVFIQWDKVRRCTPCAIGWLITLLDGWIYARQGWPKS
jgi:hypothetical protein